MSSLTSQEIRKLIADGVLVSDGNGEWEEKPLIGKYIENDKKEKILVPVDYDQIIEGGSYDLTLDTVYQAVPTVSKLVNPALIMQNQINPQQNFVVPAVIGKDKRRTVEIQECDLMPFEGMKGYAIVPGLFYLVKTVETVSIPPEIRAVVARRTTTFRCTLDLSCSFVHPGYSGTLTFGLSGHLPTFIEKGAKIANIIFMWLSGAESELYRGIWGGEKVSTNMQEERGS